MGSSSASEGGTCGGVLLGIGKGVDTREFYLSRRKGRWEVWGGGGRQEVQGEPNAHARGCVR